MKLHEYERKKKIGLLSFIATNVFSSYEVRDGGLCVESNEYII